MVYLSFFFLVGIPEFCYEADYLSHSKFQVLFLMTVYNRIVIGSYFMIENYYMHLIDKGEC